MKKRFVAKQVGVLSLTAVLAGMPAVNVLAEDVYQEKVGEVQTEAGFVKSSFECVICD